MNDFIANRKSNEGDSYVRSEAKAASASSIRHRALGLGSILRGGFAARPVSADADGTGAPSVGRGLALPLSVIAVIFLILVPTASAGRAPGFGVLGTGEEGKGAGQLGESPMGVAVNTTGAGGVAAGDVYVSDSTNNRISEYSGSGTFIRAFGQDVVASGPDNVTPTSAEQTIEVQGSVTGGTFRLGFNGETTGGSGTGTLTEGSDEVTNLLTAVGTGTVVDESVTISNVTASTGEFVVGQPISGAGIPAGAKVTSVKASTLTISEAATAEGSGVEMTSSGPPPFVVGETISGAGIPAGTKITADDAGTLTLSAAVEAGASGSGVSLTADLPYDAAATTVESALTALGTIGTGNATVSGGPGATAAYVVAFAGTLAEAPMPLITADSSNLSGGAAAVTVTTPGVSPYEICDVAANPTDVCQEGAYSSAAGGIASGQGLTVDPATGNIFLTSEGSSRVNVYSATGAFEGAFGWNVNATTPAEALQFCTFATGCVAGTYGVQAGQFGSLRSSSFQGSTPAVSPLTGDLIVPEPENRRVDDFSLALNGANEVTGAAFVRAFGGDVAPTINAKQEVVVSGATDGTFALALDSHSTDASGTGDIEAGSDEIRNPVASNGAFSRGDEVVGPGIPAGTRITVATFDSLTLTQPATASASGVAISAALPFDAEAAGVRSALEGLPNVGSKGVVVSGPDGGPWVLEFTGALEGKSVDRLAGDGSQLDGAGASVGVTTIRTGQNGPAARPTFLSPGPPPTLETCTVVTTCKAGANNTEGSAEGGIFPSASPSSVAVDSTGAIYVTGQTSDFCYDSCGVFKFDPEGKNPEQFAPAQLSPAKGLGPEANSVRWVAVDPSNDRVEVVKKSSERTFKLFEFTRTGTFVDVSPAGVSGFPTSTALEGEFAGQGPQGLAIGTSNRTYIPITPTFSGGPVVSVEIFSNPPAPEASIEPPESISKTSVTLHGVATPAAGGFATTAYFEYSANGLTWNATEPVEIGTGDGSGNPNDCPTGNPPSCNLSLTITGLVPGQAYLARLAVSNGTAAQSPTVSFETISGAPTVSGMSADEVGKESAVISGKVNPNNRSTSYYFEWGPNTSYGNRVPVDFDAVAGSGGQPVTVSASLSGLSSATTYHFRIVAKSGAGTTLGADAEFITLNSAGLPDNRAAELVSPADKQPAGAVRSFIPSQVSFQAAEDGEQAAYPILNGTAESKAGGETIFTSRRSAETWSGAQLSPPSLVTAVTKSTAIPSSIRYLDRKNFKCALIESSNPLTSDTPKIDIESGVYNLYRWTASDDSFTLITNRVPLNPEKKVNGVKFEVAGANNDCTKVFFRAPSSGTFEGAENYEYFPNATGLYEWDNGVLRDAGLRPDGTSGSTGPGTVGKEVAENEWSVSPEGRLFFTATSDSGADEGTQAVYVRDSPTKVVDASQSVTSNPSLGANYETASPDGSHVFFRANYGLTAVSSSGPEENCSPTSFSENINNLACDLYDYDVETGKLTDITADTNPADSRGAVVQGIMDLSKDGSTVYFSARGQLAPGQGKTYNQNLQGAGTASLYKWRDGKVTYVGELAAIDLNENSSATHQGALIRRPRVWVGQTTDDGEYLFFASSANITGANPGELAEAYLYSAAEEALTCVSCPGGGETPKTYPAEPGSRELIARQTDEGEGMDNYHPRSLSEDGRAFFTTYEALAPGAVAGQPNVYEWYRGQLSLLTTGTVSKFQDLGGPDGRDAFVTSADRLAPQDTDFAIDLYDFRSGGGFAAPPAPPQGCDPTLGQCQGNGAGPPPQAATGTSGFQGSGNPKPPTKKKKHHKKKHHKNKHHKNKRHKNKQKPKQGKGGKASRVAGGDRGGAK